MSEADDLAGARSDGPRSAGGDVATWLRGLGSLRGTAPRFDPDGAPEDPVALFMTWLAEAVDAGVAEPQAATLATIGADGIPDTRTLILKDVGDAGWSFAGPKSSAKASQLAARPVAALNFWWQPLVRAVRLRGAVEEAGAEATLADYRARPSAEVTDDPDWMLWRLRPIRLEFWQGAPSRRHLRLQYTRDGDRWAFRVIGAVSSSSRDGDDQEAPR